MTGLVWAVLGVFGCLAMTALGDMVSEEVRDRLDHLPNAILHLAARRLDPAHRLTVYQDEWLPELTYILKGDEARPITRLISGTWYALGILAKTDSITAHLHRPVVEQPLPLEQGSPESTFLGVVRELITERGPEAREAQAQATQRARERRRGGTGKSGNPQRRA